MGTDRACILVVDDDSAVREALKFALETEGFRVEAYAGGRQLLDSKTLAQARCLVLDCQMPDMDGFAVMAELSARNIPLPVILITAPVTVAIQRRASKAGVFNLLEKPLLDGVLAVNVHRAASLSRLQ